jgi:ABC-type cobalamin transport system ATPase subunit
LQDIRRRFALRREVGELIGIPKVSTGEWRVVWLDAVLRALRLTRNGIQQSLVIEIGIFRRGTTQLHVSHKALLNRVLNQWCFNAAGAATI